MVGFSAVGHCGPTNPACAKSVQPGRVAATAARTRADGDWRNWVALFRLGIIGAVAHDESSQVYENSQDHAL